MKKLAKAERPHIINVRFYPSEWAALELESKGTKDDYSEIVRRAVRAFFNIIEK